MESPRTLAPIGQTRSLISGRGMAAVETAWRRFALVSLHRVTVRWSRYRVDAGFRPKLVEAKNLGLLGQRSLNVPTAANRLRRIVFSDLQRFASVPSATSTVPSPLRGSRHRQTPLRPLIPVRPNAYCTGFSFP